MSKRVVTVANESGSHPTAPSHAVSLVASTGVIGVGSLAITLFWSLQLKEILSGVLEKLPGFLGAEAGVMDLLDPQTREPVLLVHQGLSQESLREIQRLQSGDIFLNRLARGELVVVNDLSQETNGINWGVKDVACHQAVFIPILSKNNLSGTIGLLVHADRQLTSREATILSLAGEQAGAAVERVRLLEKIYRGRNEWEGTFDAVMDGVFLIDQEYNIHRVNKSLARMLGRPIRELVGQKWHRVFHGGDKPIERCPCQTAMESGQTAYYELDKPHLNRSVAISVSPIVDESGNVIGCVGTVRDLTERKKMEFLLEEEKRRAEDLDGQLQAAIEKLKQTQEALISREKLAATGELAAAVAHEIRNPLSIISMSVQHIHSKLDPNDPLRECAQVITQTIERLDNLAKQLIHYSEPQRVNLKSVNLHRTLDSTLRLARAKCAYKKVEIIHHYDRALPLIQMDGEQMEEVFINIIENAFDAMVDGGKLLITTHLDLAGGRVTIQFSNNGRGIPSRHRHRIFELFFTAKKGGTGLGLALCQRIVNYHGGRISCVSKISGKNKGTTFIITLPVCPQGPESEVPTKAVSSS